MTIALFTISGLICFFSFCGSLLVLLRYRRELCKGDREAWGTVGPLILSAAAFFIASQQALITIRRDKEEEQEHRPMLFITKVDPTIDFTKPDKGATLVFHLINNGKSPGRIIMQRTAVSGEALFWHPLNIRFPIGEVSSVSGIVLSSSSVQAISKGSPPVVVTLEIDYCRVPDKDASCYTYYASNQLVRLGSKSIYLNPGPTGDIDGPEKRTGDELNKAVFKRASLLQ